MSPRYPDRSETIIRHDHSRESQGGPIADANVALLDRATQTFTGTTFLKSLELADLETTPIFSLSGSAPYICLIGCEPLLTDGHTWLLPDRTGYLAQTILESRYRAVTSQTASYELTESDDVCFADATAGVMTITLPTAAGKAGRAYVVKKVDVSVNAVTVDGHGTETIDGALTSALLVQYAVVRVMSDGANWGVV